MIQTLAIHQLHHLTTVGSARLSEHESDEKSELQYWPCYDQIKIQTTSEVENEGRQISNQEAQSKSRVRDDLNASLNYRLAGNVEGKWNDFQSVVYKVSKEKLGTAARKHKD